MRADADLPTKAALQERRSKYDAVKAAQRAQLDAVAAEERSGKRPREEDEVYLEARARADVRIFLLSFPRVANSSRLTTFDCWGGCAGARRQVQESRTLPFKGAAPLCWVHLCAFENAHTGALA